MQDALTKNEGASHLGSYQNLFSQSEKWITAAENVRNGGTSVEEALSAVGDSTQSSISKVSALVEAIASLNEEVKEVRF
jgi:hypothetical protein